MATSPSFITQEEFNLFHAIDRSLFTILVFNLGRDPARAIRAMALWLWLERLTLSSTIVHTILSLPYPLIDTLYTESLLCLQAITAPAEPHMDCQIPLLHNLVKGKNINISLQYFYDNKIAVFQGVTKIIEEVCLRAFNDIIEQWKIENGIVPQPVVPSSSTSAQQYGFNFDPEVDNGFRDPDELEDGVNELMAKMKLEEGIRDEMQRDGKEIRGGRGSNNKTLFLTFSKGYPISKNEVRDFFTRLFGDIIEGLHMQEVSKNGQPLYARLVVRDVSMVDLVLQGQSKVKFSINGKHACVRKYVRDVRRRSESPPAPPSANRLAM